MALMPFLPLMRAKRIAGFASLVLALVFAAIAGFLPPFTFAAPQRLNLRYVEQNGRSFWQADAARLPDSLRAAGLFGSPTQSFFGRSYRGDAGAAEFPAPGAEIARDGDQLTIALRGSSQADGMMLTASAPFTLLTVNGRHFDLPPASRFVCGTPDCATATVTLDKTNAASFDVTEMRRGLPIKGKALLEARPSDAVPSGAGDETLLTRSLSLR